MQVNYLEVGKAVGIVGMGAFGAEGLHYMFLAPKLPGAIYGVQKATIVDLLIALVIGVATTMYTVLREADLLKMLLGYGLAGGFVAAGLLQQFNIGPSLRYSRVARVARAPVKVAAPTYTPIATRTPSGNAVSTSRARYAVTR